MKTVTALLVVILLCPMAVGQDKPEPDKPFTKTYDIRHLLLPVRDYPMRPMLHGSARNLPDDTAGGGGGGGLFGGVKIIEMPDREKPVPTPADEFVTLVTQTIAPESWRDAGGTIGTISHLNGFLIITQTPANHDAVTKLIAQLADTVRKPLRVQAYWLVLKPEQLATVAPAAGRESLAIVPETLLKDATVYSRGQVSCFAGQVNHIASTVERNYLTDADPVVSDSVAAYDPKIDRISSGVGLQFRALPVGDDAVVLDLCNELQEAPEASAEIKLAPAAEPTTRPLAAPPTLDRPRVVYQMTQTTLRLPLGTAVLIGGVTLEPGGKEVRPREVYLVVRVDADKKQ